MGANTTSISSQNFGSSARMPPPGLVSDSHPALQAGQDGKLLVPGRVEAVGQVETLRPSRLSSTIWGPPLSRLPG